MTFGQYIKQARHRLKISLRECAKRAQISPAFLSDIENTKRLPSEIVSIRLANTLDISVESLTYYNGGYWMCVLSRAIRNPDCYKQMVELAKLYTHDSICRWCGKHFRAIDDSEECCCIHCLSNYENDTEEKTLP